MAPIIEVDDLRRRYGGSKGFEAVRGISFTVARGELFALLGTNGAGKTSSLEVIEGLAAPTSGTVRIFGKDPRTQRAEVRPRMGIMLQAGGFPSDLTVTETARMWAGTLTKPRPIAEALELVDLANRAKVAVKALSGGERRRLDLAMALLGRPEVLFLDEPTTGLDPESRRSAWELVRQLVDNGTTVILTTHYLDEAEALAANLAIMHRGAIVAAGTPAQVVAGHPSEIVFESIGQLPDLTGTAIATEHGRTTIRTHTLQHTITDLLTWAAQRRIELRGLRATSASLETAFLSLARDPELESRI